MSTKFNRKTEDFICEHCGAQVLGDGYTDHCPNCLYGKHVDIYPGDRASECGGALEPIGIEKVKKDTKIHYRCQSCGHQNRVRTSPDDNGELIIELAGRPIELKLP